MRDTDISKEIIGPASYMSLQRMINFISTRKDKRFTHRNEVVLDYRRNRSRRKKLIRKTLWEKMERHYFGEVIDHIREISQD